MERLAHSLRGEPITVFLRSRHMLNGGRYVDE